MTRIKYIKDKSSSYLVTKQRMYANNMWLGVQISPDHLVAFITDYSCVTSSPTYVVCELESSTLTSLKVKVKNKLKYLGVVFGDEIRNKGKIEKYEL
jgi:hypothetical protein